MIKNNYYLGWLFPAMLVATLLQNYYDISAILAGENLALYTYEGPIIYKLGKDIIYLAVAFYAIRAAYILNANLISGYFAAFLLLIVVMMALSAINNGFFIAVLGFRWVFPFILFVMMKDIVNFLDKLIIVRTILTGMFVCFVMQLYQLANMPPVFGEILPGVPARTPGIFIAPNSAAFFACASCAYIMIICRSYRRLVMLSIYFSLIIGCLAQSGTGIITSMLLLLWFHSKKSATRFFFFAVLVLAVLVPNLNEWTMRDDYLEISGGGRLDILKDILNRGFFSVSNFGVYTNSANLHSYNPESQTAPDSLIAAWVGNFGFFSIFAAVLAYLIIKNDMADVNFEAILPCLITFFSFSMTTIVFEAFPMNMYIAFGFLSAKMVGNEKGV